MLEVRNMDVRYGSILALKGVSLTVGERQIVALIGPNGAGKSTTLRTIAGLLAPSHGEITFSGQSIAGLPAESVVRRGIALCPEGRRIFGKLTVLENLRMGAYTGRDRRAEEQTLTEVFTLFARLKDRRKQLSGTLSGGEQQMLAIGRALMARPRLLLLDEPSMGLAPLVVQELGAKILEINRMGVSVLLVEQNVSLALSVSSYCYVLETGNLVAHGTSEELRGQQAIIRSYLGV